MIKFYVVKEAKEAVLYFVQDFQTNFDCGWQPYQGRMAAAWAYRTHMRT